MAARRLIAVLVVLLVVSSIAAALAPEARRATDTSTDSTSSTTTTAPDEQAGPGGTSGDQVTTAGRILERRIGVRPTTAPPGKEAGEGEPEQIDVLVGDQLALEVVSNETVDIEIPDFGQFETAAEFAPARFDLLLREPGSYAVRIAGGAEIATIVVGTAADRADATKPGESGEGGGEKEPAAEPEPAPTPNPDTQAA